MSNEEKAIEFSNNPKLVEKFLREAITFLNGKDEAKVYNWQYDKENKRMIYKKESERYKGKTVSLQWLLRDKPNKPESYKNQQTTRGTWKIIVKELENDKA